MLLRIVLFLVMGAALAGFGAVAWISTRPAPPPAQEAAAPEAPAPVPVQVLAAARSLRAGQLLTPDDIAAVAMAPSAVPAGARLDTPAKRAELLGGMLRRSVTAGDALLPAHVMRAGDRGFLAAVLGKGMRAATVAVDAVSGTAGLIWPGDHVDLILTQTIDQPAAPLGRRIAGETVLRDVRVIAIDQELMQGATAASVNGNPGGQSGRTVTLEVSPDNAERIAVATRLGHLSLSVVAADSPDNGLQTGPTQPAEQAAARGVTWGGDVSEALHPSGGEAAATTGVLHLFEGNGEGKDYHF